MRSAAPERAADALRRLSDIARACGTDWALGAEARSRALVTEGEAAKNLYREAIGRRVAERARTGLRAAGGHARQRAVEPRDSLTAQEAPIARLAGEGASNPEIAAQLFISRATVAYHPRKVFTKLGISSRSELATALPARRQGAGRVAVAITDKWERWRSRESR